MQIWMSVVDGGETPALCLVTNGRVGPFVETVVKRNFITLSEK
jgi:hypothetical protein